MDAKPSLKFLPCGHIVCCDDCYNSLDKDEECYTTCPLCRTKNILFKYL